MNIEAGFTGSKKHENFSEEDRALLYNLNLKALWKYLKNQEMLLWLVLMYLFFEYGRPQTIYPAIDVLPFAQIVILLTVFMLFLNSPDKYVSNVLNKYLLLFFLVILLSSANALSPELSFEKLPDFIAWMLIYFIIINVINTKDRFFVFILLFLLLNFKMAQFSFRGWASVGFGFAKDGTGGGPGWFLNAGEFGIAMCVFFPLAFCFYVALRDRWPIWKKIIVFLLPTLALTGMVSSSSRGAVVGGIAVIIFLLLNSKNWMASVFVVCVTIVSLYLIMPSEQLGRFDSAGIDSTSNNRIERWEKGLKMVAMFPVLGVGYENWAIADIKYFDGNGALSHNIFIQCASELGYSGLLIYCGMIFYVFNNNRRSRINFLNNKQPSRFLAHMATGLNAALIGYLVSGFFVTVLFYPYFWINMAMSVALNNISEQYNEKNIMKELP